MDWTRLALLDDGTPACKETIRKLIGLFLETSRTGLDTVQREFRDGRERELKRALHKLKGGCATVGAAAMLRSVEELERLVEAGKGGGISARLDSLESEFTATRQALLARP